MGCVLCTQTYLSACLLWGVPMCCGVSADVLWGVSCAPTPCLPPAFPHAPPAPLPAPAPRVLVLCCMLYFLMPLLQFLFPPRKVYGLGPPSRCINGARSYAVCAPSPPPDLLSGCRRVCPTGTCPGDPSGGGGGGRQGMGVKSHVCRGRGCTTRRGLQPPGLHVRVMMMMMMMAHNLLVSNELIMT